MNKPNMKKISMLSLIAITISLLTVCTTFGCTRSYDYIPSENIQTASEYFYNQGLYALHRKNAVDAIPYFSEAIRVNPKHADAYYERARIYSASDMTDQSKIDFETAKKLSKKYRLKDTLEPFSFKLSKSDIEIIKSVPVPADAAIVAEKPKPLKN